MNVYECIAAVSAELAQAGISKTRSNQQQGYKFRGIDDVYNALAPIIAKHKLVILPRILTRTLVERQTQKGGVLFNVTVEAEFDFVSAIDGSRHVVRTFGEAMDSADKATNKAMSAAYKYAAFQTFCIPTEGDHDADATTPEPMAASHLTPTVTAGVRPPFAPAPSQSSETETDDALRIERIDVRPTKNPNVKKHLVVLSDGRQAGTIKQALAALCEQLCQEHAAVEVETKSTQWGEDLIGVRRAGKPFASDDEAVPLDDPIPF